MDPERAETVKPLTRCVLAPQAEISGDMPGDGLKAMLVTLGIEASYRETPEFPWSWPADRELWHLRYAVIGDSKVAIANELHGIDPWDVEFGMPLKIVFKPEEERKGIITDFHFEPAEDWNPSPMNKEKERIKKLVEPVYEWVKTIR